MLVATGFVAVIAIDALYLGIIRGQGDTAPSPYVVPFVASYLAAIAVALLASLVSPLWLKAGFRGAASGGLLAFGGLSALTIGPAVMITAFVSIAATILTIVRIPGRFTIAAGAVGSIVAILLLVIGLQLAWSQTTG